MCCGGCGAIACIFTGTAMMTAPCISTLTVMPARPYRIPARLTRMRMAFRWRSLLVGLMHGMAGSAALLVLAASQASSAAAGLAYIAVFGIGSMVGMGALSAGIPVAPPGFPPGLARGHHRVEGPRRRVHHPARGPNGRAAVLGNYAPL